MDINPKWDCNPAPRRPAPPPHSPPVLFLTYDSCLQTWKYTFFYTFIHICGGILTKKMITNFTGYFTCNKTPLVKWVGGSGMWREGVKGNGRWRVFPYISFWSVYSFKCIPLRCRFFKIYSRMRAYFEDIDQYQYVSIFILREYPPLRRKMGGVLVSYHIEMRLGVFWTLF